MLPTTVESPSAAAWVVEHLSLAGAPSILGRHFDTLPLGYNVSQNALSERNRPHPHATVSPSMFCSRAGPRPKELFSAGLILGLEEDS